MGTEWLDPTMLATGAVIVAFVLGIFARMILERLSGARQPDGVSPAGFGNRLVSVASGDLFSESPVAACVVGAEGSIVAANKALARLVGLNEGGAEGLACSLGDLLGAEAAAECARLGLDEDSAGGPFEAELTCRDGSRVAVEVHVSVASKGIQGSGLILQIVDRSAARHLLEMSRRYLEMIDTSIDAIISHGADGTITSWNAGAEQMLGFDRDEMLGRSINDVIEERMRKRYWNHLLKLRNSPDQPPFELEMVKLDGSVAAVSMSVSRLEERDFSLIARDISRQKAAETHVDDLYAAVSHELRTPLSSIYGGLSTVVDGLVRPDSVEGLEMVAIARENSQRLLRIINDILDFRKLEAGKVVLRRNPCVAIRLLKESARAMSPLASAGSVNLVVAGDETALVDVDKDRIVQSLTNLISNAIKHSTPGQEVKLLVARRRSGRVRFSVVDSGAGVPEEHRERLFEKYYQVDRSHTGGKDGVGLGLAITRAIIEMHGGNIGFESGPDAGSTFWFELDAGRQGMMKAPGQARDTLTAPVLHEALILGSDRRSARLIHDEMIERGIGCHLVSRADELLPLVRSRQPSLLLVDQSYPSPAELLDVLVEIGGCEEEPSSLLFASSSDPEGPLGSPTLARFILLDSESESNLAELWLSTCSQKENASVLIVSATATAERLRDAIGASSEDRKRSSEQGDSGASGSLAVVEPELLQAESTGVGPATLDHLDFALIDAAALSSLAPGSLARLRDRLPALCRMVFYFFGSQPEDRRSMAFARCTEELERCNLDQVAFRASLSTVLNELVSNEN